MTHPALIERITRSLAYMLRHQPEKFGLSLDPQGFGELTDVVRALSDRVGEPVEIADVENAVVAGDRPRYEIRATKIRALYGHSIEVEPGEPAQPPEFLFVGVDSRAGQLALQSGMRGGRLRFLHLALSQDDAREAGRRAAQEYSILRVYALDAWEEGVNFFDRKTLYLTEEVPRQYIELVEQGRDGYEPREGHGEQRGHDNRRRPQVDRGHGRDAGSPRSEPRDGDRPQFTEHHRSMPRTDERREQPQAPVRREEFRPQAPRRTEVHSESQRREQPRREDVRSEVPRRDDARREPAREAPRGDELRNSAPRREEFRRSEPRRDDYRREEPRREEPRREEPRREEPRREEPRREEYRRDEPRGEGFRSQPEPRREATRSYEPRPIEERTAPATAPVVQRKAAVEDHGAFGLGIFEEEAKRAPAQVRAPSPPAARPQPAPQPKQDDDSGFGAGL